MNQEVAITGIGAVSALGVGADVLVDRWAAGESGIENGQGACLDFEPGEVLTRKEVRRTDRFTQFAITAAAEALEQAGWLPELPYDPRRIGCVIGTGFGGLHSFIEQQDVFQAKGPGTVSPFTVPLIMANAAAGNVSMRFGLQGAGFSVISACASGADAVGTAVRSIQAGDADAVVAGGADATLDPMVLDAFAVMDALSPSGICRPFDVDRDGFVMGEGSGIVVLENAERAASRGARPIGAVAGYGATSDAFHLTAPNPDALGACAAIEAALSDAGVSTDAVDYVNAHGTGTPMNDRAETKALKKALGDHAGDIPISSVKSAIGHLMGAAGGIEVVATVGALRKGIAPPTVNFERAEEDCDLDYVPREARPLSPAPGKDGERRAVALSNAFGFGGHNSVLCLAAPVGNGRAADSNGG